MKYRIKDDTERKLINALFGITEFTSEFQDNSLTIRASFAGNDFGVWFFKTEPVQELAEGWHPYPEEKPKEVAQFLVARKRDASSANDFGIANWGGGFFYPVDSNIFAWREMPKVWKGD